MRGMSPKAFDGAEDRKIEITLQDNRVVQWNGLELLRDWSIAHFYFHVVTGYDILRHNGVAIGKRDYMNHVGRYVHQRADRYHSRLRQPILRLSSTLRILESRGSAASPENRFSDYDAQGLCREKPQCARRGRREPNVASTTTNRGFPFGRRVQWDEA